MCTVDMDLGCRFCCGVQGDNAPDPTYASVLASGSHDKLCVLTLLQEAESWGLVSCINIWCMSCRRVALICSRNNCTSDELVHAYTFGKSLCTGKKAIVIDTP